MQLRQTLPANSWGKALPVINELTVSLKDDLSVYTMSSIHHNNPDEFNGASHHQHQSVSPKPLTPCDHQQSLLNMAIDQPLISVPKPNPTLQAFYSTSKGIRREGGYPCSSKILALDGGTRHPIPQMVAGGAIALCTHSGSWAGSLCPWSSRWWGDAGRNGFTPNLVQPNNLLTARWAIHKSLHT